MATFLGLRVDQSLMLMGQRVLLLVVDLFRTSSSSTKPLPVATTLMSLAMEIIVMLLELDAALSLLQKGATASRL
jgi:hypothetical protein